MNAESPAQEYLSTLQRVKRKIDRTAITVFTDWNDGKSNYDTARYRVELVVTKLETQ